MSRIFALFGLDAVSEAYSVGDIMVFDVVTMLWTNLTSPSLQRSRTPWNLAANGSAQVAADLGAQYRDDGYIYPLPRYGSALVFRAPNTLYLYGGNIAVASTPVTAMSSCDLWSLTLGDDLSSVITWELLYTSSIAADTSPARGSEMGYVWCRRNHMGVLSSSGADLVVGWGNGNAGDDLQDSWRWNVATRAWTNIETQGLAQQGQQAPGARDHPAAAALGNSVFMFGGQWSTDLNDLWSLSTDTWVWRQLDDPTSSLMAASSVSPTPRAGSSMMAVELPNPQSPSLVLWGGMATTVLGDMHVLTLDMYQAGCAVGQCATTNGIGNGSTSSSSTTTTGTLLHDFLPMVNFAPNVWLGSAGPLPSAAAQAPSFAYASAGAVISMVHQFDSGFVTLSLASDGTPASSARLTRGIQSLTMRWLCDNPCSFKPWPTNRAPLMMRAPARHSCWTVAARAASE